LLRRRSSAPSADSPLEEFEMKIKQYYQRYGRRTAAAAGALLILILMFLYLTGNLSGEPKITPSTKEAPPSPSVAGEIVTVKTMVIPVEIEAVGAVDARETAQVSSRTMALITRIYAAAGDVVKKGQPLVELDARDAQAQLAQAREALASAQAELERTRLDAGRIERLHEKQAATRSEYDAAQAALTMAQAQVDSAKARVREAEVSLSFTKIEAPLSGKVIDRLADPGDMAVPGQPILGLYDPSSLRLEVIVPERLVSQVQPGRRVRASIDALDLQFEAEITQVVPSSDVQSRSFIVRVPLPQKNDAFPGMYGRIWIPSGSTEALLIPQEAVRRVGQLEMVTVVEDGAARTRTVKTGKKYPQGVEVLSGLEPGEQVVLPQKDS